MNPNVRAMLEDIHSLFRQKFRDKELSWDRFIEFIAGDHSAQVIEQLGHGFNWLLRDKELTKSILRIYDTYLLASDYYDHLGDMYYEKFGMEGDATATRESLHPKGIEVLITSASASNMCRELSILDPKAGTGRLLMAVYKYASNCKLFGAEPDIRAIRVALTNMAIHDIPCFLLHADSSRYETDISTENGKYNWRFANKWFSHIDELKPMTIVQPPNIH
jgi:type I restriction-modification system DNA methylase subunit